MSIPDRIQAGQFAITGLHRPSAGLRAGFITVNGQVRKVTFGKSIPMDQLGAMIEKAVTVSLVLKKNVSVTVLGNKVYQTQGTNIKAVNKKVLKAAEKLMQKEPLLPTEHKKPSIDPREKEVLRLSQDKNKRENPVDSFRKIGTGDAPLIYQNMQKLLAKFREFPMESDGKRSLDYSDPVAVEKGLKELAKIIKKSDLGKEDKKHLVFLIKEQQRRVHSSDRHALNPTLSEILGPDDYNHVRFGSSDPAVAFNNALEEPWQKDQIASRLVSKLNPSRGKLLSVSLVRDMAQELKSVDDLRKFLSVIPEENKEQREIIRFWIQMRR